MKFRIRKFLTMSMLFSMFGGFVSGMEKTLREGWAFVYKAECPQGNIDAIVCNKLSPKYYCLKELYNRIYGEGLIGFVSKAYSGGGSCSRCNQRFVNSNGNDPAHHFENCNCKLCNGCVVTMENFSDYKCSEHGNKLKKSAILTINLAKANYDYFKTFLKMEKNKEEKNYKDLKALNEKALDVMANAYQKYSKSQGNDIEKLKEGIREYTKNQGYNGVKNSYDTTPRACACDILSSAINFQSGKGVFNGCPNCRTNNHPVYIPQCGHPICLNCLKGVVDNKNKCPICSFRFYRIIILREKKDGDNLENFLASNKSWILQAVNG